MTATVHYHGLIHHTQDLTGGANYEISDTGRLIQVDADGGTAICYRHGDVPLWASLDAVGVRRPDVVLTFTDGRLTGTRQILTGSKDANPRDVIVITQTWTRDT